MALARANTDRDTILDRAPAVAAYGVRDDTATAPAGPAPACSGGRMTAGTDGRLTVSDGSDGRSGGGVSAGALRTSAVFRGARISVTHGSTNRSTDGGSRLGVDGNPTAAAAPAVATNCDERGGGISSGPTAGDGR